MKNKATSQSTFLMQLWLTSAINFGGKTDAEYLAEAKKELSKQAIDNYNNVKSKVKVEPLKYADLFMVTSN